MTRVAGPVYVEQSHVLVDDGPAEYEPPAKLGVEVAPLAVEPIQTEVAAHPVVDAGLDPPAEPEPDPGPEPLEPHEHKHPLVDSGPAEVEPVEPFVGDVVVLDPDGVQVSPPAKKKK